MSARGNGGRYEYYACTGRQKYGPKVCPGERLSRQKLEQAVLGQLADVYRDGALIRAALAAAREKAARERPVVEEQLASVRAEIAQAERSLERYFSAFEQRKLSPERCEERLSRVEARLADLRSQEAELVLSSPDERGLAPTAADLAAVADELERVLAEAAPPKAKALLRLLIAELKVNGRSENPADGSSRPRFAQRPEKWR
jgi:exonuclease VII small subunit